MIWLVIVFGIITLVVVLILLAPISMVVNTDRNLYQAGVNKVAVVKIDPRHGTVKLRLPFYSIDLLAKNKKTEQRQKTKKPRKSGKSGVSRIGIKKPWGLLKELWQTFKVRRFHLNMDTGDYTVNARLYPLFMLMSGGVAHWQTNFRGRFSLQLHIENRLIRWIKPMVKHIIFKKKRIINKTYKAMEMNFEELLGKITDFIQSEAKTDTVIGEQFKLGEFTCVPVIKVGIGFGSGGGTGDAPKAGKGGGGGAGAGMGIEPIGFLVTREDQISFMDVGKSKGLSAAFEKVPDLFEKFMKKTPKKAAEPV
ncbi:MAG: GerW family sporulation protein [Cyclobacteriaceae bacterium]|nr:GerW family sporulation protein [Cyclobacteriaceae bacterium]